MCAIIGTVLKNPTTVNFKTLHRIFLESKIRGLHATGISYVKCGKIITEKYPIPADEFPFNFPEYVNEDGNLYLIGHCRYSTSDLEYNQPISNENVSVVHNGVITQKLPEHWEELYGYKCSGRNDTELLLHTLEEGKSPLIEWKDSSLAVCELHKDKTLRYYRNGNRPMYYSEIDTGFIITSTYDIPRRAGIDSAMHISLNCYYTTNIEKLIQSEENVYIENALDLQEVDYAEI
jgi:asparagine synthetase B (glutamine-hydrolysing)